LVARKEGIHLLKNQLEHVLNLLLREARELLSDATRLEEGLELLQINVLGEPSVSISWKSDTIRLAVSRHNYADSIHVLANSTE
jgi:hypothetical protein